MAKSMTTKKDHSITFTQPSLTQQAFKEDCDINNILKNYSKTQLLDHVNRIQGTYGDFSNVTDYQSSLNAVMAAEETFMGLPALIRERFANDPSQLMSFVENKANYDEAVKLGLIIPINSTTVSTSGSTEPSK